MSDPAGQWQIEQEQARLVCGSLVGRVEFKSAGIYFQAEKWNTAPADSFQVLFTRGPAQDSQRLVLDEWYVRGRDLVARFQRLLPDQIAPEFYWQAQPLKESAAVQLELTLSVRTDLLDSAPLLDVSSCSFGGELLVSRSLAAPRFEPAGPETTRSSGQRDGTEHIFLFRDRQRGLSYAQMTHPSDFHSAAIDHDGASGRWRVRESLFPERLEKGVIRRGRICGWFLPVESDEAAVIDLARQFVDEPLPLTA